MQITGKSFDLRDVMLEAQAEVQDVVREVMEELEMPKVLEEFRLMWAKMSPVQKEKYQQENPEDYAMLIELMK
jgi:hypothetical protein